MNTFNWGKAIGFGVVIWLIMFGVVSLLMNINLYDLTVVKIILVGIAGLLSYLLISNVEDITQLQAFAYGLSWVVIGVALDLIVSSQLTSGLFNRWEYWVGYAMILLTPAITTSSEDIKNMNVSRT